MSQRFTERYGSPFKPISQTPRPTIASLEQRIARLETMIDIMVESDTTERRKNAELERETAIRLHEMNLDRLDREICMSTP